MAGGVPGRPQVRGKALALAVLAVGTQKIVPCRRGQGEGRRQVEGCFLGRAVPDGVAYGIRLVGVEPELLARRRGRDVHLLQVDRRQGRRRHAQDDPLHGPALGAEGGFDEAMPEMPGVLADHPAVVQPDVTTVGEPRNAVHIAIVERMLAVQRLHRAGEADDVALRQGDRLRPVERELGRPVEAARRPDR